MPAPLQPGFFRGRSFMLATLRAGLRRAGVRPLIIRPRRRKDRADALAPEFLAPGVSRP